MGVFDRLRSGDRRSPAEASEAPVDQEVLTDATPVVDPVPEEDLPARAAQLIDLDDALRRLARTLAADTDRMRNPGWAGRVADYRAVAAEAARLEREGFQQADLTDLASQVVPLWSPGTTDLAPEYTQMAAEHAAVLIAVAALRSPVAPD